MAEAMSNEFEQRIRLALSQYGGMSQTEGLAVMAEVVRLRLALAEAEKRSRLWRSAPRVNGRASRRFVERLEAAEAQRDSAGASATWWKNRHTEDMRRIVPERDEALAALARVKALHYPANADAARTPFCADCNGAPGVHGCGCWQDEQQTPVCGHCTGWKGVGPVDYPCATIRAAAEGQDEQGGDRHTECGCGMCLAIHDGVCEQGGER